MHNFICTQIFCINFRAARVGEKLRKKLCPLTDRHENCICTTSFSHKHYVQISEEYLQKCLSNALDNNDLVRFTSPRGDNSATKDSMVMKIAHAKLYNTSNIVCNRVQYMQYCRIISLDNNNLVKFTSSRGDYSTINDSMVMKIAHAQLHM